MVIIHISLNYLAYIYIRHLYGILIINRRANTTPEDIDREAEWIFKKIIHEKPNCNEEAVKEKITIILTQYLKEYFDVIYIYIYILYSI